MSNGWQDRIVGARMAVDDDFAEKVRASSLSNSQWGLVMTAVEFEIEDADDPEHARIVADTSKLEHVLPELENVDRQMQSMGGDSPGQGREGGVMDSIKNALGLGGGGDGDEELEREAKRLAEEYAAELQGYLKSEGRWEEIRNVAASE